MQKFPEDKFQSAPALSLNRNQNQKPTRSSLLSQQTFDHFRGFDADEFLVETLEGKGVFVGINA